MMHSVTNKTCSETIMPPFLLILNPLRDKKCVMMLCSIEIESLRDIISPLGESISIEYVVSYISKLSSQRI